MITRILYTQIWMDYFFSELTPEEKLLFIYLLTNETVNILHIYSCSDRRMASDTGIDTPLIKQAKRKFEEAGKIYFKAGYVFLKNAHKYEIYSGPNNEIAKQKIIDRLSKPVLDWYNNLLDTPLYTPSKGTRNKKEETISHNIKVEDSHVEDINPAEVPI